MQLPTDGVDEGGRGAGARESRVAQDGRSRPVAKLPFERAANHQHREVREEDREAGVEIHPITP